MLEILNKSNTWIKQIPAHYKFDPLAIPTLGC
jgi:hypothetical protein